MRYTWLISALILMMLPASSDAQRQDAPPYAERGTYKVGTVDLSIDADPRALDVTLWYPTLDDGEEATIHRVLVLQIAGEAIRDADLAPSDTPYPLVLVSHGSGGSRYLQRWLTEHLASRGFIVMAVDHPRNNFADSLINRWDFTANYAYRPLDVLNMIDFAAELNDTSARFADMIDITRTAVIGHSFGGTTALQVAGARLDFARLADHCASAPADDNTCFLLEDAEQTRIADLREYQRVPDEWPVLSDPRIAAIVLYAPWNGANLDVSGIDVPTLLMYGTADTTSVPARDALAIYERLDTPRYLTRFVLGGHNLFIDACPPNIPVTDDQYRSCMDAVWAMPRAHDLANHLTTAFLDAYLRDDDDARAALAPQNVDFRGVEYDATGVDGDES